MSTETVVTRKQSFLSVMLVLQDEEVREEGGGSITERKTYKACTVEMEEELLDDPQAFVRILKKKISEMRERGALVGDQPT